MTVKIKMAEEVKKYLYHLMSLIDGLYAIVISDKDGVPIVKALENAPEMALRPTFLSTFGMASEQSGKLGLGANRSINCVYQNYQVVQMNSAPFFITLIAKTHTNSGLLMNLDKDLQGVLNDLRQVLATTL